MAATAGTHAAAPTRPAGLTKGERRWGYVVWAFAGGVIAVPELWAGLFGNPWFLTISDTVGHLEQRWSLVKILVIALIVAGAVQALAYPQRRQLLASRGRQERWRSSKGRLTEAAGGATEEYRRAWFYFPAALLLDAREVSRNRHGTEFLRRSPQKLSGHYNPLYLVGPFVDLGDHRGRPRRPPRDHHAEAPADGSGTRGTSRLGTFVYLLFEDQPGQDDIGQQPPTYDAPVGPPGGLEPRSPRRRLTP